MDKKIESNQVYPISAQNAYLANRAKHNLEFHEKLPYFEDEGAGWVKDFAQKAMGEMWEDDIDDIERVRKCADRFWNKSLFEEPLKGMVEKAHSTAAENCVKSAMPKLVHWHQELTNACSIINTSLSTEINKINDAILALENSIKDVETVKKNINFVVEKGLSELSYGLNELALRNHEEIKNQIENFFKSGKLTERQYKDEELNTLIQEAKKYSLTDYASIFLAKKLKLENIGLSPYDEKAMQRRINHAKAQAEQFDENNPIVDFKQKQDADDYIKVISDTVEMIFENLMNGFSENSNLITSMMTDELSKKINSASMSVIEKAKEKLKNDGFQLNLSLPEFSLQLTSFDAGLIIEEGFQEFENTKQKRRRKDSIWGNVCNFFGTSDWGWETYEVKERLYQVNTDKIRENLLEQLNNYTQDYKGQFEISLNNVFKPEVDNYINKLTNYLERYRDLFLSAEKANAEMEQEKKKQLIEKLSLIIKKSTIQLKDTEVINSELSKVILGV
jgi:hypothetical protein